MILKNAVLKLGVFGLLVGSTVAYAFSSAGFGDSTGGPTKQGTTIAYSVCSNAGCHTGNALNSSRGTLSVTSDIPASGWEPGQTYNVSISFAFAARDVFGWQLMAWGSKDSASVGRFTTVGGIGTVSNSVLRKGGVAYDTNQYFTHTAATVVSPTSGSRTITVKWTAPTNPGENSQVVFYCASVMANGNGTALGDFVFRSSHTVNQAVPTGLAKDAFSNPVSIYPVPAKDFVNIDLGNDRSSAQLMIYSVSGKVVRNVVVTPDVDQPAIVSLDGVNAGGYLYKIMDQKGQLLKKGAITIQ